jgi:glucose/arabinose dehydrogenase
VLDQWVDPDNPGPDADHVTIVVPSATPDAPYPDNMAQGHINVAVRVTETQNGYRYNYALQNFDFDRGIEAFRVPFPEGAQLIETWFGGVDGEPGDDWSITVEGGYLNFEAPANNALGWFKLFNFEFETDLPPTDSEITLDLGGDAVVPTWTVAMLGPDVEAMTIPADAALEPVFPPSTFNFPVALRHAGDGSGRRFVVERDGVIRIIDSGGNVLPDPFLDISSQVDTFFEGGLLGLAFHPDFANNGRLYVYFTADGSPLVTRIAEFEVDGTNPDQADPSSQNNLLSIPQPAGNHNGGDIHFGPDGYLYIGMGDGGPSSHGQNLGTLLGSMLRIDVDNDDFPLDPDRNYAIPADNPFVGMTGLDETWAYGLRNPYRWSFDRDTGDLWIADVGQSTWEEINLEAAVDPGGHNYGWDVCEGSWQTGSATQPCNLPGSTLPAIEYRRISPHCSITGGYRYRGPFPSLQGLYAYGDYCSGQVWLAWEDAGEWTSEAFDNVGFGIVGFGEDEDGHLYLLRSNGEILRFEADAAAAPQVVSVDPDHGPETGGTPVTITGTDFLPGADVTFGASACNDIEVVSATEIACVTPAAAPGSVDVTVTNTDDQSATLVGAFTYNEVIEPALTLSTDLLDFGEVQVGQQAALDLVLENTGTAALMVSSLDVPDAPFSVNTDDCGGSTFELAPEESCLLSVILSPVAGGEFDDTLVIVSNADSSPDSVALAGTGTQDSGDLEVTPLGLNFGEIALGRSESLSMVLTNVADKGAADLDLVVSVIAGTDVYELDESASDCGSQLPPQESCSLTVRFSPLEVKAYSGVLRIQADGQNLNYSLQGRGVEPEPIIFEDRFELPDP